MLGWFWFSYFSGLVILSLSHIGYYLNVFVWLWKIGVSFAPFPEEEVSDYTAHGPIIRVLTVGHRWPSVRRCLSSIIGVIEILGFSTRLVMTLA